MNGGNTVPQAGDPLALSEGQRRLAQGGRRGEVHFGGDFGLVLTGYEDIREMLASPDFTAAQPPFPAMSSDIPAGWFFGMDPPEHTRYRRRLADAFSLRSVRELTPAVEHIADDLLDDLANATPGEPPDLVESYVVALPTRVMQHLLGVTESFHATFRERMRATVSPDVAEQTAPDELGAVQRRMWADTADVVHAKRLDPGDDLLSDLARADGEQPLSEPEVVGIAMTLLIAGNEAVENLLGMAVLALLHHPAQWAALRARPESVDDAVEEFLRHLPINNFGAVRTAVRDCTVGGTVVHENEVVLGLLSTANRDPSRFGEPDRFDTARPRRSNLAFGHGVHTCLGAHLARLQVRIGVLRLIDRFPHLRIAERPDAVRMRESVGFYGVDVLRVALDGAPA